MYMYSALYNEETGRGLFSFACLFVFSQVVFICLFVCFFTSCSFFIIDLEI